MYQITLKHIKDDRGTLTVVERLLPFAIKRVFFLHGLNTETTRGGHGHFRTKMALLATSGSFRARVNNGVEKQVVQLRAFESILVLSPEDWHLFYDFSADCVVTVFASEDYDKDDYFHSEPV